MTFSAADAAPAALPGAWPAHRGAGSALALRNWRVARRLIALVAIPTVLGLALAGLRVTDEMRSAQAYGQVGRLAVLGQQATGLAQAMEDERADTAAFIAAGRPASGLEALHREYAVTNRWARGRAGWCASLVPATRRRPGPARPRSWPASPNWLACVRTRRSARLRRWP